MNVWITGASSGIGEACAYRYASENANLILTARNREALERVAQNCRDKGKSGVRILPYDLQESDGIKLLSREAWSAFGGIDILVLNAGISQRTTVEDTPLPIVRKIMELNFFSPVATAEAVLPMMIENGGGRIAVTTSIAGKFGFPLRCAYSASKHALNGFFETLRAENHDKGISVTLVCPGRIRTNISINALDKGGVPHGVTDPGQSNGLDPDKAAKKIVSAIKNRKNEVLVGQSELLMVYLKRFLPKLCVWLSQRINPV